jgi:hypothetical protein
MPLALSWVAAIQALCSQITAKIGILLQNVSCVSYLITIEREKVTIVIDSVCVFIPCLRIIDVDDLFKSVT